MANPSKQKGDRWENACIKFFHLWGFELARTKAGSQHEVGDVAGDDLCAYELRDRQNVRIWQALRDARRHADVARKKVGVAIIKQAQKPTGEALVAMSFADYMLLRSLIERESVDAKAERIANRQRSRAKRADPEFLDKERKANAAALREKRSDPAYAQDERNQKALAYANQTECERRARVQVFAAKRRAKYYGAPHEDYESPLLDPEAECECCGSRERLTVDHVEHLHLGAESAGDVLSNIRVYCHSCNASRGRGVACRLVH